MLSDNLLHSNNADSIIVAAAMCCVVFHVEELIRTASIVVGGPNGDETHHAAIANEEAQDRSPKFTRAALNTRELSSRASINGVWLLQTLVRQPTAYRVGAGGIERYVPASNAGYRLVSPLLDKPSPDKTRHMRW